MRSIPAAHNDPEAKTTGYQLGVGGPSANFSAHRSVGIASSLLLPHDVVRPHIEGPMRQGVKLFILMPTVEDNRRLDEGLRRLTPI